MQVNYASSFFSQHCLLVLQIIILQNFTEVKNYFGNCFQAIWGFELIFVCVLIHVVFCSCLLHFAQDFCTDLVCWDTCHR
jgi:hypothetical protein